MLCLEIGEKMADIRIICKRHDEDKVITHVGLEDDSIHTVLEIWNRIKNNEDSFCTYENKNYARVYARQRRDTGRKYLTTDPDGTDENNLDFLPECN